MADADEARLSPWPAELRGPLLLLAAGVVLSVLLLTGVTSAGVDRLGLLAAAGPFIVALALFRVGRMLASVYGRHRGPVAPVVVAPTHPVQAFDQFAVEQKLAFVINRYEVSVAPTGQPICHVEQRRFTLFAQLRATSPYGPEDLFRIRARTLLDAAGRYVVTDHLDRRIGQLVKDYERSLVRSTWWVLDGEDVYDRPGSDRVRLGGVRRRVGLRDRYVIDVSGDTEGRLDRRLAIALAVGLDALGSR